MIHESKAQMLAIPDSSISIGVPDTLRFSVSGTDETEVTSSYFRFEYDSTAFVIEEVFTDLDEWLIVSEKAQPGVVEVATLSPTVRLFDGPFFSFTVTPLVTGSATLNLVDGSWSDCRNIQVLPNREVPTNPPPEDVEALYETVYWVDSVYGDDDNADCSDFDTPCKTTKPIDPKLFPGDAVIFMGGTHRIDVQPVRSGEPNNYITYASYPNQEAIISGANVSNTIWANEGGGVWSIPYMVSLPKHPAAAKPQDQWRPEMLIANDSVYLAVYNLNQVGPGNFYVQGPSTNPTRMYGGFDSDPNMMKIELAVRDTVFVPPSPRNYILIENLTFTHGANSLGKTGCLEVNGMGWIVRDVDVEWCNTTGVKFYGAGHDFSRVTANSNGVVGWNAEGASGVYIRDSEGSWNNWKGFLPNWHAGGAKITHGTSYVTWDNFLARGNNGPGIWYDIPWGQRNKIINSFLFDNQVAGIFLEHGTIYTLVQNNVIQGTRKYLNSGSGVRLQAAADNAIISNTVYGNAGHGIFDKYKDKRSPPGHNFISRNIVGWNGQDSSSDSEIRIDRDPVERIVSHFSDNVIVRATSPDVTFFIQTVWDGDVIGLWLQHELHIPPYDRLFQRTDAVLEDPNSPDGWRSLIEGYGATPVNN